MSKHIVAVTRLQQQARETNGSGSRGIDAALRIAGRNLRHGRAA